MNRKQLKFNTYYTAERVSKANMCLYVG
jgi:hypothetical protein